MNVYILNSKIKNRDYDGIVLDENDFHPCRPFFSEHPEIKPETIDNIVVKGIFERCSYLRAVLRYCDYMLKVGGIMNIYFYNKHFETSVYSRSRNDWQYEYSLVFGARGRLIEQRKEGVNGYFKYQKVVACFPDNDTIDKWTFGIVSAGRANERVMQMINQLVAQNIPNYEIIICGPSPSDNLPSSVKVLSDEGLYPDIRIPISRKKNYIIDEAKYNNIMMMHDRYTIPDTWYENMKIYGNYYDLMICKVLDDKEHTQNMGGWNYHHHKPLPNSLIDYVFRKKTNIGVWDEYNYINGGFFIFKKSLGIRLNPECNWGEKEDVDFCRRAYHEGILMTYDPNNVIYSTVVRTKLKIDERSKLRKKIGAIKYLLQKVYIYYADKHGLYKYIRSF